MHNRTQLLAVSAIVIVIACIALAVFETRKNPNGTVATTTAATSTAHVDATATSSQSGYKVTPVYAPKGPDPEEPLVFSVSIDAAQRMAMNDQFTSAKAVLQKDPLDFNAWITIGLLRKTAGDFKGAAADWEYVSTLYPKNVVSFANLSDLYSNYLPNYEKAAAAYQQAIKNAPSQMYLYDNFYQLYSDRYAAAGTSLEATLKAGIQANPKAAHLQVLLARYYKSVSRSADAKAQYDAAIANATAQGQTDLATQIKVEAESQ